MLKYKKGGRELMEITVTEAAQHEIARQLEVHQLHTLKLVYDTAGCGCGVNGVPQLLMAPRIEAADAWLLAAEKPVPIIYNMQDAIYFEAYLTLDYKASARAFMLKSNNQIYNANLSLIAPTKLVTGGSYVAVK
jgi:uncharacterized protein YqkB